MTVLGPNQTVKWELKISRDQKVPPKYHQSTTKASIPGRNYYNLIQDRLMRVITWGQESKLESDGTDQIYVTDLSPITPNFPWTFLSYLGISGARCTQPRSRVRHTRHGKYPEQAPWFRQAPEKIPLRRRGRFRYPTQRPGLGPKTGLSETSEGTIRYRV